MNATAKDPLEQSSKLDRLFNRAKFRRRTLKVYRIAGPLLLAVFLYLALVIVGLVEVPATGSVPGWLYSAYLVLTMAIAAITPVLFLLSTIGGLATAADWRFAAPLWCFSAASGLFLVTALLAPNMPQGERIQVWTIATVLLCLCASWATVVGYARKAAPAGR